MSESMVDGKSAGSGTASPVPAVPVMEQAKTMLNGILSRMGVVGEVVASEDAERVTLVIEGAETGLLIGKHGATLDALQYLVNKMVSKGDPREFTRDRKPVTVDAEGYRGRRAEALTELAKRLAQKARKTKKPVAAAPMSAADRRVMHMALADLPGLSTRSEGEGAARRLMVIPDPKFDFGPEPEESDADKGPVSDGI